MRATGVRSRRGGARAALAAALWCAAVSAHAAAALLQPQADGPLTTRTIEFADLVDGARGDRRVPIKVHLPSWTGPFPVVVLSHGAGGNWDSNHAQARHLASHGYVVLALEHVASNTERMRKGMRFGANMRAMTRDASEVLGPPARRRLRARPGGTLEPAARRTRRRARPVARGGDGPFVRRLHRAGAVRRAPCTRLAGAALSSRAQASGPTCATRA